MRERAAYFNQRREAARRALRPPRSAVLEALIFHTASYRHSLPVGACFDSIYRMFGGGKIPPLFSVRASCRSKHILLV